MHGTMARARAEAIETRERYDELMRRKHDVEASLHDLDTDYGSEAALRERFGVARPGEVVIVLTDLERVPAETSTATTSEDDGWFW